MSMSLQLLAKKSTDTQTNGCWYRPRHSSTECSSIQHWTGTSGTMCCFCCYEACRLQNAQVDDQILGILTNNFGTTCLPINVLFGLLITECWKMSCLQDTFTWAQMGEWTVHQWSLPWKGQCQYKSRGWNPCTYAKHLCWAYWSCITIAQLALKCIDHRGVAAKMQSRDNESVFKAGKRHT